MYLTDQDRHFNKLSISTKFYNLDHSAYARRSKLTMGIYNDTGLEIAYIRPYHKRKKFLFEKVIDGCKNIMSSIRRIYKNAHRIWTIWN